MVSSALVTVLVSDNAKRNPNSDDALLLLLLFLNTIVLSICTKNKSGLFDAFYLDVVFFMIQDIFFGLLVINRTDD